jgi:radical SAM protein with 4Fe4S-binding SPASM domain
MARGYDALTPAERQLELERPRPKRSLPIAPTAPDAPSRDLAEARDKDKRYTPIYAVWEITLACDLACRHCGSRAGRARPEELSTAECLEMVRQMAELGIKEVSLIGGEAYLREDWLEIVRAIGAHGMKSNMTTGGRGLTVERCEQAKAAGLEHVSVSIDGLEAAHDRLRGVDGSWKAAFEALANLRAAGIPFASNTQINRLTMPDLPELLELLIAAKIRSWQIQLTVAMGRAVDEPEVLLQPYDLLHAFPMIAELKKRTLEAGVVLWPGNNIGYFGPYEALLRGTMPRGHASGCGAGRTTLGIEADGTIKGCPSLTTHEWAGGNFREHSLREVWERGAPLRYTRDRTVDDLWGFCRDCYYADTCRAGCTWTSSVLLGRPGNNPYCHHRALELDAKGKRERVERVEEAPGLPFDHGLFRIVVEDKP